MSGECVLFLVLSHHSKDLKRHTSVTTQSFIRQAKESTPLRHEGRPTPKESAASFYVLSPSAESAIGKLGQLRRRCICFTWSSHSSPLIFFCSIFMGFFLFLSFSHLHFGVLFPILTTQQLSECTTDFLYILQFKSELCTKQLTPRLDRYIVCLTNL